MSDLVKTALGVACAMLLILLVWSYIIPFMGGP